jgi:hypothetical protein
VDALKVRVHHINARYLALMNSLGQLTCVEVGNISHAMSVSKPMKNPGMLSMEHVPGKQAAKRMSFALHFIAALL